MEVTAEHYEHLNEEVQGITLKGKIIFNTMILKQGYNRMQAIVIYIHLLFSIAISFFGVSLLYKHKDNKTYFYLYLPSVFLVISVAVYLGYLMFLNVISTFKKAKKDLFLV